MKLWKKLLIAHTALALLFICVACAPAADTDNTSPSIVMEDGTVVPEMRLSNGKLEYLDESGAWQPVAELSELYQKYVVSKQLQPTATPAPSPTSSPSPTPSPSATPTPQPTPEPTPKPKPKPKPTAVPKPASTPDPILTPAPTNTGTGSGGSSGGGSSGGNSSGGDTGGSTGGDTGGGGGDGEDISGGGDWSNGYD